MVVIAPLVLVWLAEVTGVYRTKIIETLDRPARVVSFDASSLTLSSARTVPVPDILSLPASPGPFFQAATAQGVEVTSTGRIIGLIRVHRWCGNDPVREHVARVDLARLLIFTGEAAPSKGLSPESSEVTRGRVLRGPGMSASDYYNFQTWSKLLDQGVFPLFAAE